MKKHDEEFKKEAVKEVFYLHRQRYGARRISAELLANGVSVGRRRAGSYRARPTQTPISDIPRICCGIRLNKPGGQGG